MRLLLDTQALLNAGRADLPKKSAELFEASENDIYFSLVSLWEIGIKAKLGKLRFKRRLTEYHELLVEELGLIPLAIEVSHIEKATNLPLHHKDPFDRLLIGQALTENFAVLSADSHFEEYGCKRIWD